MHALTLHAYEVRLALTGTPFQLRRVVLDPPPHGIEPCPYSATGWGVSDGNGGCLCDTTASYECPFGFIGDEIIIDSRLTIRIKSVRVQRLGDVTRADCFAEGVVNRNPWDDARELSTVKARVQHRVAWDARRAHRDPQYKSSASPWTWVAECELVTTERN